MIKFLYNPEILRFLYPEIIFQSKGILFTFDDGPDNLTESITLKFLNSNNIKGLFFFVTENISEYKNLLLEIKSEGHIIGLHGMKHTNLTKLEYPQIKDSLLKGKSELENIIDSNIHYFRPPFGRFNNSIISATSQLNLKIILWNLLTYDYLNKDFIFNFVISKIKQNSILVFHENKKSFKVLEKYLNLTIHKIHKRRLIIGSPSECLK